MNELIAKIEQWAEDRNIIKGSKPIDQAMKLFSEFGELADNVGKGRDCRDDIGDVFVVLTIISRQTERSILDYMEGSARLSLKHNKEAVTELGYYLAPFVSYLTIPPQFNKQGLVESIRILKSIAINIDSTLEECVQIAYNDIKDRAGVIYNGVFIKESDPAYQDALDNIEADKRMATQKRISVNIEDL